MSNLQQNTNPKDVYYGEVASYNSDNPKKIAMVEALKKSLGIVSVAAKEAGISRDTHYHWLKHDKEYATACLMGKEAAKDFAESKLFELMNGIQVQKVDKKGTATVYALPPNVAAIIFYLKTQAKDRGFIEKIELTDLGGDEVESTISF